VAHQIEIVLAFLAVVVVLGVLAQWMRIAYPILLVVAGLLLSLQPWVPRLKLEPDIVFLVFLPPLLYSAAFNTEWRAFRAQLRAISLLAFGLVLFTTTLVAILAHEFVGLPWASAFILGAIVSPPDAVAAAAITQRVKVPRIIGTILEGESLVNDASALVALRIAISCVAYTAFDPIHAGLEFLWVSIGGVAVGLIGAIVVIQIHRFLNRSKLGDAKINIAITLLTPYAVYLPAEQLHVSGVLAAVAAGLWIGTRCERVFTHEFYQEARAVWEMVEFMLNGVIFILIGLQLPVVLDSLNDSLSPYDLACFAVMISAVVILARMVWVFPGAYLPRLFDRAIFGKGDPYPPWQAVTVVGWTGMRGVVSLAAALAIPTTVDGVNVEGRSMIQFLTFWVIFATLVGQGLTLPLVIRVLGVSKMAEDEPDEPPTAC